MRALMVPRQRSAARPLAGRRPAGPARRAERAQPCRTAEPRQDRAAALGRAARRPDPPRNRAAPTLWSYRDDGLALGPRRGMAPDRRLAAPAIRHRALSRNGRPYSLRSPLRDRDAGFL